MFSTPNTLALSVAVVVLCCGQQVSNMEWHLCVLEEPSTNVEMFPSPNTLAPDVAVVVIRFGKRFDVATAKLYHRIGGSESVAPPNNLQQVCVIAPLV